MSGEEWRDRLQPGEVVISYFPELLPCSFAWKAARFHTRIGDRAFVGAWNDDMKEISLWERDEIMAVRAVTSNPYAIGSKVRSGDVIAEVRTVYEYTVAELRHEKGVWSCGRSTPYRAYIYLLSNNTLAGYWTLSAAGGIRLNLRCHSVNDTTGVGIANSRWSLVRSDNPAETYTCTTGSDGYGNIPAISTGQYRATVEAVGFATRYDIVQVTQTENLISRLTPGEAPGGVTKDYVDSQVAAEGSERARQDDAERNARTEQAAQERAEREQADNLEREQRIASIIDEINIRSSLGDRVSIIEEKLATAFSGLESWLVERIISIVLRGLDIEADRAARGEK